MNDIGQQHFYQLIEKFSTNVKLVYSKQAVLNDGTPATEIFFESVVDEYVPVKTLILSTYWNDKLIFAASACK